MGVEFLAVPPADVGVVCGAEVLVARIPETEHRELERAQPRGLGSVQEGVQIAREMLHSLRDVVQGAQISAPMGKYSAAADVLEVLGTSRSVTA